MHPWTIIIRAFSRPHPLDTTPPRPNLPPTTGTGGVAPAGGRECGPRKLLCRREGALLYTPKRKTLSKIGRAIIRSRFVGQGASARIYFRNHHPPHPCNQDHNRRKFWNGTGPNKGGLKRIHFGRDTKLVDKQRKKRHQRFVSSCCQEEPSKIKLASTDKDLNPSLRRGDLIK